MIYLTTLLAMASIYVYFHIGCGEDEGGGPTVEQIYNLEFFFCWIKNKNTI